MSHLFYLIYLVGIWNCWAFQGLHDPQDTRFARWAGRLDSESPKHPEHPEHSLHVDKGCAPLPACPPRRPPAQQNQKLISLAQGTLCLALLANAACKSPEHLAKSAQNQEFKNAAQLLLGQKPLLKCQPSPSPSGGPVSLKLPQHTRAPLSTAPSSAFKLLPGVPADCSSA